MFYPLSTWCHLWMFNLYWLLLQPLLTLLQTQLIITVSFVQSLFFVHILFTRPLYPMTVSILLKETCYSMLSKGHFWKQVWEGCKGGTDRKEMKKKMKERKEGKKEHIWILGFGFEHFVLFAGLWNLLLGDLSL